ncbi:MAG: hypothetical protein GY915_08665 [bacterium]|nr:hypothetical protein [bacterium]
MKQQKEWREKVSRTFGEKGEDWLRGLPSLIDSACEHWNLRDVKAFQNLSYNYVGSAEKAGEDSSRMVLKLCCTLKDFDREILALKRLASSGCVPVLDFWREARAMLLTCASGETLKSLSAKEDHENIIPLYGRVVRGLQQAENRPKPEGIPTVEEQIEGLEDRAQSFLKEFSLGALKGVRQDLKTDPQRLIHGDLHLENILEFEGGWKAIDPKGTWGPLAFEVSAYDLLSKGSVSSDPTPEKTIERALKLLAQETDVSLQQLCRWVVVRCILSAAWFVEDNLDPKWPLQQLSYLEKAVKGF